MRGGRRRTMLAVATALALGLTTWGASVDGPATARAAEGEASARLAGTNRFGTAAAIAAEAFPEGAAVVYLARSDDFADAVAAGTLTDGPVLLVRTTGAVPVETADAIASLDPAEIIALGGPRAVSDQVLAQAADGRPTARVAGTNRYETAVAISRRGFPDGAGHVFVAAGEVDAIAAGSLTTGPILLVPPVENDDVQRHPVPDAVAEELERMHDALWHAISGPSRLRDLGRQVPHVNGSNRVRTSLALALYGWGELGVPRVYVGRADDPVDAVAAGALRDGPVILHPRCGPVDPVVASVLLRLDPVQVVALGGPGAICDELLADLATLTRAPLPIPAGDGLVRLDPPDDPDDPFLGPWTGGDNADLYGWSRNGTRLLISSHLGGGGLQVIDPLSGQWWPVTMPSGWVMHTGDWPAHQNGFGGHEPQPALNGDGSRVHIASTDPFNGLATILALDVEEDASEPVWQGFAIEHIAGDAAVVWPTRDSALTVVDLRDGSTWALPDDWHPDQTIDLHPQAGWVLHADGMVAERVAAPRTIVATSPDRYICDADDDLQRLLLVVDDQLALYLASTGETFDLGLEPSGRCAITGDGSLVVSGGSHDEVVEFPGVLVRDEPDFPDVDGPRWAGGPDLDGSAQVVHVLDVEAALAGDVQWSTPGRSTAFPHVRQLHPNPADTSTFAVEVVQSALVAGDRFQALFHGSR